MILDSLHEYICLLMILFQAISSTMMLLVFVIRPIINLASFPCLFVLQRFLSSQNNQDICYCNMNNEILVVRVHHTNFSI